jgi:hypothetical protein
MQSHGNLFMSRLKRFSSYNNKFGHIQISRLIESNTSGGPDRQDDKLQCWL